MGGSDEGGGLLSLGSSLSAASRSPTIPCRLRRIITALWVAVEEQLLLSPTLDTLCCYCRRRQRCLPSSIHQYQSHYVNRNMLLWLKRLRNMHTCAWFLIHAEPGSFGFLLLFSHLSCGVTVAPLNIKELLVHKHRTL